MVCLYNTHVRLWVKPCREDSLKDKFSRKQGWNFCQRVDTFDSNHRTDNETHRGVHIETEVTIYKDILIKT